MKKTIKIKSDRQRKTLSELIPEIPDNHVVKICPIEGVRRTEANAYYWKAVIEPMADYRGYSKKDLHDEMKQKHLYPIMLATDEGFNETVEAVRSVWANGMRAQATYMMEYIYKQLTTTILTVRLFWEYVEEVKKQAIDDNIRLMSREEWENGKRD